MANGIREVATTFNQNRIKFYDVCKMTIKEFATYAWDSKASERGEDKPLKENDHCMDAVRYFVNTIVVKSTLNASLKGGI